jgi:membrane-bound lytic murein transglycosylase D
MACFFRGFSIMKKMDIVFRLAGLTLFCYLLTMGLPPSVFSVREMIVPAVSDYPLPEAVTLCGERMPLEDRYVREMFDREFTIMVWDRAQVFMWLKRAGRYFPFIEKELSRAGVPEDLKYLAVAESSLIPHIRSSRGALGTWQFMAHTGRRNGLRKDRSVDERRCFERSTEAAVAYLKRLKDTFGTWTLALAAYNMGDARLKREIKHQKVNDYYRLNLPLETERFVFRIAAIKAIMEEPEQYGYHLPPERIYKPVAHDIVKIRTRRPIHITDIAQAVGMDFKDFKELNPQILGYYLPTGRYTIKVPPGLGTTVSLALEKLDNKSTHDKPAITGDYYVVQPGDTLIHISKRSGVPVAKIKRMNGIHGSLIRVGQRLRLTP